jgi:hypothetical protein
LVSIENAKRLLEGWAAESHEASEHFGFYLEWQFIEGVAIEEASLLGRVSVKVEVVEQPLAFPVVPDEMLHAVDRRLPTVADKVVAVEVVPFGVQPVEPLLYPVRIQHGHHHDLEVPPDQLGILRLARQKSQDALSRPAGGGLAGVHSTTDQDHRLVKVLFGRLDPFLREENRVRVLSYLFLHLGAPMRRSDGNCVHKVQVARVA